MGLINRPGHPRQLANFCPHLSIRTQCYRLYARTYSHARGLGLITGLPANTLNKKEGQVKNAQADQTEVNKKPEIDA